MKKQPAQGLMAGINAAFKGTVKKKPFTSKKE